MLVYSCIYKYDAMLYRLRDVFAERIVLHYMYINDVYIYSIYLFRVASMISYENSINAA